MAKSFGDGKRTYINRATGEAQRFFKGQQPAGWEAFKSESNYQPNRHTAEAEYTDEASGEIRVFRIGKQPEGWLRMRKADVTGCVHYRHPETGHVTLCKPFTEPPGYVRHKPGLGMRKFVNPKTGEAKRCHPGSEPKGWIRSTEYLQRVFDVER